MGQQQPDDGPEQGRLDSGAGRAPNRFHMEGQEPVGKAPSMPNRSRTGIPISKS